MRGCDHHCAEARGGVKSNAKDDRCSGNSRRDDSSIHGRQGTKFKRRRRVRVGAGWMGGSRARRCSCSGSGRRGALPVRCHSMHHVKRPLSQVSVHRAHEQQEFSARLISLVAQADADDRDDHRRDEAGIAEPDERRRERHVLVCDAATEDSTVMIEAIHAPPADAAVVWVPFAVEAAERAGRDHRMRAPNAAPDTVGAVPVSYVLKTVEALAALEPLCDLGRHGKHVSGERRMRPGSPKSSIARQQSAAAACV